MSFRLLIECTKDIDELHINFSDGTSTVVESPRDEKVQKTPKEPRPERSDQDKTRVRSPGSHKGAILDTDVDFGSVSQEVVKPPEIQTSERPVKVAEELQNFDF